MIDAAVCEHRLAELRTDYLASLRQRTAALMDLSALAFNRPGVHDALRDSEAFRRWRHWSGEAQSLKSRIDQLAREFRPAGDAFQAADRSTG